MGEALHHHEGEHDIPRTLHLHAGLPKCGSSTLQAFLLQARAALLAAGYDYPPLVDKAIGNLTPFLMSLRSDRAVFVHNNPDFDRTKAQTSLRVALATSEAPNMILSSEGLTAEIKRRNLNFLWDGFDRVVVHLFIRPRASMFASHYTQTVKSGKNTTEIEGFLSSAPFAEHVSKTMNFSEHAQFWDNLIGVDNIRFHFLSQGNVGPVEQFLAELGLAEVIPVESPANYNISPSAFVTCVLASVERGDQQEFLKFSRRVRRMAAKVDPFPSRGLLTDALVAQINRHYAKDTAKLLAVQDKITRVDLEPNLSEKTHDAVTFAEIRATEAYGQLREELARIDVRLR